MTRKFLIRVLVSEDILPTVVSLLTGEVEEITITPADVNLMPAPAPRDAPKVRRARVKREGISPRVLRQALEKGLHGEADLQRHFEEHFLSPSSVSPAVSMAIKAGWAVRGPGGVFLVKNRQ